MWRVFPAIILLAFMVASSPPPQVVVSYINHKVYSVYPKNLEQLAALSKLQEDYDFWIGPSLTRNDILVRPEKQTDFLKYVEDTGIKYEVMIDNLQSFIDEESNENKRAQKSIKSFGWTAYHSWNEIMNWVDDIPNLCPEGIAEVVSIGKSTENRDIKMVKLSTGGFNKSAILIDGTFHAREWISPAVVTYFLNDLCINFENNKDFLDAVDIHIIPVANPDGYEHSREVERMWRKTRSYHGSPLGCRGVDPNRNFEYQFGGPGTSDDPCSNLYRGPEPFSEPESQAIQRLISNTEGINYRSYITVHSYGQYILIPWSWARGLYPEDYDELKSLADLSADALTDVHGTRFRVGQSADMLGPTAGCADDWAKSVGVKYTYTYELRDRGGYGFLLPPSFIIPTAQETIEALKVTARFIANE